MLIGYLRNTIVGLLVVASLFTLNSCRRMETSNAQWREIVQTIYPVDTVDAYHTWNLLEDRALTIAVRLADSDITHIQVLSGNPYEEDSVEILAERPCKSEQQVNPSFKVPAVGQKLYVAAINSQGKYYVMPVGDKTKISIGGSSVIDKGVLHRPIYQTFTYLFEEDYPYPGDFDFNDVVFRISQQPVNDSTLKIQVTLAAVGATKQVGAAIRLPYISYADVEKVTIDEGTRFDEDYTIDRYYIANDEVLSNGRDGSAVINLFDDAHWSMSAKVSMGQVKRMYYNTRKYDVLNESSIVPAVSRSYNVHLKNGYNAYFLSLADIDPFIIVSNNGFNVEVHTYQYKYDEALWDYTNGSGGEDDRVPWALLVPDADFHYPVEGIALGMYRNGLVSGAYSRYNHSFGQWGRNRNISTDWWLLENATSQLVF